MPNLLKIAGHGDDLEGRALDPNEDGYVEVTLGMPG